MMVRSILVAALFVATSLLAQPQRMTPQERTDRLATQLSLSAEQKAKVLALFTRQDEARQKAFQRGDREGNREAMGKLREETNKEMKSILTAEQFAKYESIRGGMGPRGGGPGTGPGGAGPMTAQERADRLAKNLSLSAEQKAKVLQFFTEQDHARQEAMKDRDDRGAMRAAMQKQREETDKKLKTILTKEQYTKYKETRMPPDPLEKAPQ
jgi:Spy/CpxP family protein refolding chaperone